MMIDLLYVLLMFLLCSAIIYFNMRNNQVYLFLKKILEEDWTDFENYPSYNRMLFSFKKLTKENWRRNEKTKNK